MSDKVRRYIVGGSSIGMLVVAGVSMLLAAAAVWIIEDKGKPSSD